MTPGVCNADDTAAALAFIQSAAEHGAAAYRHALGFVHISLGEVAGRKARLHVWNEDEEPSLPICPIHDHAFSFRSLILQGELEHRPYEVTATPHRDSATHRVCSVLQADTETIILPTDRLVRARPVSPQTFQAGQSYTFQAGLFHESRRVGCRRTVTFLQAERIIGAPSYVLSPSLTPSTMTWRKQRLPRSSVSRLLNDILAELATREGLAPRPRR